MLSKEVFWDWFRKEVQIRWKKHHFEWVEMGDWYWRLREFDMDTLTQAVRQHKACEDWSKPSLKKVYEHAKAIQKKNRPTSQRIDDNNGKHRGVPEAHTYIMCTRRDDRGNGIVGWFIPILLWPFNKTYTHQMYRDAAQQQCDRHRSTYGGAWEVFTATNHGEMLTRRRGFQKRCQLNQGISQK